MEKIIEKLEKIDKNTMKTLMVLSSERDESQAHLSELDAAEGTRKEQLKEAQKKFKTIGFKARAEIFEGFETFAKDEMGASSLSAFIREYSMFLFENRSFQNIFKEFQILQKNDEKQQQISFFTPQYKFEELENMADDEGFTICQLTQKVMLRLLKDKELRTQIISKIHLD